MGWLIAFIIILFLAPFLGSFLIFVLGFVLINILIVFLTTFFGITARKKSDAVQRRTSRKIQSPLKPDDDVEDADFKENP